MGKDEVVDYLLDTIEGILSSAPIAYVKWDMNRCAAETNSPEAMHRHILGVYRLWGALVKDFPEILFEGCAGGGGRFDFGSLAYMPQFWTSDQTDAVERQAIQFGSSLLFPPETMGAHVSAVPNHQVGRVTPPETRALAALCFNYGYELNLHEESEADRAVFARYSAIYKGYRRLFRTGKFERLLPEQESFTHSLGFGVEHKAAYAWAVVSPDRSLALVFYFQTLAESNGGGRWLRVHGLDPGRAYRDAERDVVFEAAFLAGRGLWIPPVPKDYRGLFWILEDLGRGGPSH